MSAPLALAVLLALGAPASALNVRVPSLPPKFAGGSYGAAWRVWEAPLLGAFSAAHGGRLALSPELAAFAPMVGVAKKDGAPPAVAPRSAALHLLTVQLQEAGLKPADFAALPPAERVARMQAAYDALRGELKTHGEALAAAAAEAEKAGDRAALHDAQARLSLLVTSHADYIDPQARAAMRAARDRAYAAHAKLTETVVDGTAKSASAALGGAPAGKAAGFAALGESPDPWRGGASDPHAAARRALLAPLAGGKVPAEFIGQFARYQQMGDPNLSFDALKAFKPAAADPFAAGEDAARALQGIGLVAREAPAERARDLAVQALTSTRYLAPHMESLRAFTLRDVGLATQDKERMARVLKSLAADAGEKREGPAGEALKAVEEAWQARFGVPDPVQAAKSREAGDKLVKKGLSGLLTGLIPVAMAAFGWFPTAMPGWLPFLSFLNPFMPFMPYVGLVMAAVYLGLGYYRRLRAGPRR